MAIILACLLLWAAFEDDVCINEQVIALIPSDLQAAIRAAWSDNGGGGDVNPIENIGLIVCQCMDQLDIIPVNINSNGGSGSGVGRGEGAALQRRR